MKNRKHYEQPRPETKPDAPAATPPAPAVHAHTAVHPMLVQVANAFGGPWPYIPPALMIAHLVATGQDVEDATNSATLEALRAFAARMSTAPMSLVVEQHSRGVVTLDDLISQVARVVSPWPDEYAESVNAYINTL